MNYISPQKAFLNKFIFKLAASLFSLMRTSFDILPKIYLATRWQLLSKRFWQTICRQSIIRYLPPWRICVFFCLRYVELLRDMCELSAAIDSYEKQIVKKTSTMGRGNVLLMRTLNKKIGIDFFNFFSDSLLLST